MFGMGGPAFLEPILANHLITHMEYTPEVVSGLFGIPTLGYALAVKIQSMLPSRVDRRLVMMIGLAVSGVGFVIVGPWEVTGLPHSIVMTGIALFMIGSGSA
mmetsp:Transcript_34142/g.6155  ORF Transcript_34142/g.6155 Transcript_34142/m.6155 type:complete len:102 (+) Transcript_34142:193-498(+)